MREEARFIRRELRPHVRICGVGKKNAEQWILSTLKQEKPGRVLTCGYAGGLDPALALGTVVFDTDPDTNLSAPLQRGGAIPVRFFCADRILSTAAEKQRAWRETGAAAVEMESEIIRSICLKHQIPSATVRVISDVGGEDMPLDFNRFISPTGRLKLARLLLHLAGSPRAIGGLLGFWKATSQAARTLGQTLNEVVFPVEKDKFPV
jgi:nucleoside phosphorylase